MWTSKEWNADERKKELYEEMSTLEPVHERIRKKRNTEPTLSN